MIRALFVGVVAAAAMVASADASTPSPVLVGLQRTGGFAAIEKHLAVHRDGRVTSDGYAATAKVPPARLAALKAALVDAKFATLERVYESDEPIADGYTHRITYAGKTVRIEEGAKLPPRLQRVFTQLMRLTHG